MSTTLRNYIALGLIIVSLMCLFPGLLQPMFRIKIATTLPIVGKLELYDSIQSILEAIRTLYENDNTLVAFLILFFSVMVPIIKAVLLLTVLLFKGMNKKKSIHRFVAVISKWSMADVFVVGVFLAYLATNSDDSIDAELHKGFYYFLSYCIISILAVQIMKVEGIDSSSNM